MIFFFRYRYFLALFPLFYQTHLYLFFFLLDDSHYVNFTIVSAFDLWPYWPANIFFRFYLLTSAFLLSLLSITTTLHLTLPYVFQISFELWSFFRLSPISSFFPFLVLINFSLLRFYLKVVFINHEYFSFYFLLLYFTEEVLSF